MIIHEGLKGLRELPPGSVLSIGNFDGMHRGHLAIVERARELKYRDSMGDRHVGGRVVAVTFEPHPLTVLRPDRAPLRLTPRELKLRLLAAVGVDDLVILPPTHDVLNLTAEQFWEILRDEVRPSHLVEGGTFTFGRDRGGTVERLRDWTRGTGTELHIVDGVEVALLNMHVVDVNSSLIRWLIANGRMRDAAICLARPYSIEGKVVEGSKRGRTLGFPTANIECTEQLLPSDGVFAAHCMLGGTSYPVALSIGSMPTFGGVRRQVEAHIVGFSGDLYGRTLHLDVIDWLREQRKFQGIDALKQRIELDVAAAADRAEVEPSRAIASP